MNYGDEIEWRAHLARRVELRREAVKAVAEVRLPAIRRSSIGGSELNDTTDIAGVLLLLLGLIAVFAAAGSEFLSVIAGLGALGLASMALGVRRLNKKSGER